jgi:hypothetical protein
MLLSVSFVIRSEGGGKRGRGGMGGRGRGTVMTQMLSDLHVTVSASCYVKIPLHLIPLQTPKNPTTIRRNPSPKPRRPLKLPSPPPHLPKHMPHMSILLFQILSPPPLPLIPRPLHPLRINPRPPRRGIFAQHFPGENAVAAGVLDVYVQV